MNSKDLLNVQPERRPELWLNLEKKAECLLGAHEKSQEKCSLGAQEKSRGDRSGKVSFTIFQRA